MQNQRTTNFQLSNTGARVVSGSLLQTTEFYS